MTGSALLENVRMSLRSIRANKVRAFFDRPGRDDWDRRDCHVGLRGRGSKVGGVQLGIAGVKPPFAVLGPTQGRQLGAPQYHQHRSHHH